MSRAVAKRKQFLRQSTREPLDHWELQLTSAKAEFDRLAEVSGLPWIDKWAYKAQFLDIAAIAELPKIEKLNSVLRSQVEIGTRLREAIGLRERLADCLRNETCAIDEKSGVQCGVGAHRKAAQLLRSMDDATDTIVELISEWRQNLNRPMPFLVHGGVNYLVHVSKDCSLNGVVTLASSHLRGTSRHLNFFYASTYDSVAAATMNLMRPELMYILGEVQRQRELCQEQISLAKMGFYIPVLRFSPCIHSSGKLNPTQKCRLIAIDKKSWKEQLLASYANAAALIERSTPVSSTDAKTTEAATQFLLFSSRTMHIRYFRKWLEWLTEKKRRRTRVDAFLDQSRLILAHSRYRAWFQRHKYLKSLDTKVTSLLRSNVSALRQKYISRWFVQTRLASVGRAVRRQLFLKYYHALFYVVYLRRIQKRTGEHQLRHLYLVSQLKPESWRLPAVRSTHTSLRPFLQISRMETEKRLGASPRNEI